MVVVSYYCTCSIEVTAYVSRMRVGENTRNYSRNCEQRVSVLDLSLSELRDIGPLS